MPSRERLDDATADAVLAGRPPADRQDLADLAAFADEVRRIADAESPEPSEALAAVFVEGLDAVGGQEAEPSVEPPTPPVATRERWLPSGAGRLLGALSGVGSRVAVGVAALVVAVLGAGLGGVLPQPANELVARAVETATPFRVTDGTKAGPDGQATESDGRDQSGAGDPGADGGHGAGADEAAGSSERGGAVLDGWMGRPRVEGRPEFPGHHGRERAADTPAGEHVPAEPGPPDDQPSDPGQGAGTPPSQPGQQQPGQAPSQQQPGQAPSQQQPGQAPSEPGQQQPGQAPSEPGQQAPERAPNAGEPGAGGDPGAGEAPAPSEQSGQSGDGSQRPGSGEPTGEAGGSESGSEDGQLAPGGQDDGQDGAGRVDPDTSEESEGPLDGLPQPSAGVGGGADGGVGGGE